MPRTKKNILSLPLELLEKIATHLTADPRDFFNFSRACKQFSDATDRILDRKEFSEFRKDHQLKIRDFKARAIRVGLHNYDLSYIVELDLQYCDITIEILDDLLDRLPNLRYLNLFRTKIHLSLGSKEYRVDGVRKLRRLSICWTNIETNHDAQITDLAFTYIYKKFSCVELDISFTKINTDPLTPMINFEDPNNDHKLLSRPLSSALLVAYLIRYAGTLRHLIIDQHQYSIVDDLMSCMDLLYFQVTCYNYFTQATYLSLNQNKKNNLKRRLANRIHREPNQIPLSSP